jgi:hypothetical protein
MPPPAFAPALTSALASRCVERILMAVSNHSRTGRKAASSSEWPSPSRRSSSVSAIAIKASEYCRLLRSSLTSTSTSTT